MNFQLWITLKVLFVLSLCGSLITLVYLFDHKVFHPLGWVCMTLNAADFAAPLAGLVSAFFLIGSGLFLSFLPTCSPLAAANVSCPPESESEWQRADDDTVTRGFQRVVLRRRATSTLPLPLCIANFMVSTEWFIYGLLVWDFYLIVSLPCPSTLSTQTPNGIGSVLATAQLFLFIILPRKPAQRSPMMRLFNLITGRGPTDKVKDVESDGVNGECLFSQQGQSSSRNLTPKSPLLSFPFAPNKLLL